MFFLRRATAAAALSLALIATRAGAQSPRDLAVELTATVAETPPTITLQWAASALPVLSQTVLRRLKDAPTWTAIATPATDALSFTDSNVTAGVNYEYYVYRRLDGVPNYASGYLSSGIRAPLAADRGRVVLAVDDTMSAPLASELATFTRDLIGDGWTVVRVDISRANATPPSVRAALQSLYAADPAHTVAVILFGHIPVPYSGDFAIDGHGNHFGAWPTDAYYGDMDGTWTDTSVNDANADDPRNRNVPGDGKFDQTILPSAIELQVGRIDLNTMPAFSVNETELLRRYLNRDHNYRQRQGAFASVPQRGLVDDNFGYFGGEAFASTAWRGFTPCVGAGNVSALDWFTTLNTQAYQWAYGCGGGSYFQAAGVGTAADFANTTSLAVFNVLFGSYFGDWDNSNAFLRAPLAGTASSFGLVSVWSGRPHWAFHAMAMGETIGYATRVTQNNENSVDQGYETGYGAEFNHIALLGDPTLRLYPVSPPPSLTAVAANNVVTLNWSASADGAIAGYIVSSATGANGPYARLFGGLVTGTSFVDRNVTPGASYTYLVRAVKLETSPSGTFLNSSQGIFSANVVAAAASGPELNVSSAGSTITSGDITPFNTNGTDFGTIDTTSSVSRTFTITNSGNAALSLSTVGIAGANAGDFSITTFPPTSFAAGASADFVVKFKPLAPGARLATLTLASNDADEATYSFAIDGTGVAPAAALSVNPPAINRSIHANDATNETLTISNRSLGTLQHTVTSTLTRYSALDSDSFAGPTYQWIDIAATGSLVTSFTAADDGISAPIALGFAFPFYGTHFTTARVCTNGYLTFTDQNTNALNTTLPNRRAAENLVAPFWTDLNIDSSSHVYTQSVGGNFVVQFDNVSLLSAPTLRVTCEVILKPSGEIVFQYLSVPTGVDYSIGLQNAVADDALLVAAHVGFAHAGLAIRLRPPGAEGWLALSNPSGTVAPGSAQDLAVTLNASGLAPGDYSADLVVNSNAANSPSVSIPVHLTVGNTPVENWRLENFGTTADTGAAADDADPDADAQVNLLEYAFGTLPNSFDAPIVPVVSTSSDGYLQIQFPRHTGRTDLHYLVEATENLTDPWTTIASSIHGAPVTASGAHSVSESGSSSLKTVTVEDSAPMSAFTKRFLRVRIVRD